MKNLVSNVFQFELKVTDNAGLSAKDTLQIMIDDPTVNHPLIANAGADQTITLPINSANLDDQLLYIVNPSGMIAPFFSTTMPSLTVYKE